MFRSMFQSEAREPVGRYRAETISGQLRQKSHLAKVQERLNEGDARGWRLLSASTTNASGAHFTSIYWDTTQER